MHRYRTAQISSTRVQTQTKIETHIIKMETFINQIEKTDLKSIRSMDQTQHHTNVRIHQKLFEI